MFKKLVSDIPFNPSLIEHIPEYRASLRKERKLRMVGLGLLIVAFLIQVFISVFPAQSGLASSPNDLITGGFSSQSEAVRDCYNNVQNYRSILAYYSISCSSLVLASSTSITASSYNNQLYSLNRLAYGQTPEKIALINQQTYWLRQLSQGNGLPSSKLKALTGTNSQGVKYIILYNSGNLSFIGAPVNSSGCNPNYSSNCPKLFITARNGQVNNADGSTVQPGNTIIYTLAATNLSKNTIYNFVVATNFSSALSYSKISNFYGGSIQKNNYISWPATTLTPGQTITKNITFTVNSPISITPLSSSDPNYYNMKMTTVYGNTVSIKLPWSFSKFFELKINNGFPSQGLIFSLVVSALMIIFVGYFLYRNSLMLKELNNVKEDYLNGGGN